MNTASPSPLHQEQALVIFSGGQDSATCLAWALSRFERVQTLGFDYGQRHNVELVCRQRLRAALADLDPLWASRLGPDTLLNVDIFRRLADTALTSEAPIAADGPGGLPTTFVPGRNLLFILHAAVWAYAKNIRHLILGVCQSDSSGYPDCRDTFVRSLNVTLNLAMDERFVIHTPLMDRDKSEVWELADELGVFDLVRTQTLTCYNGIMAEGCGHCPACKLRREGLEKYLKRRR